MKKAKLIGTFEHVGPSPYVDKLKALHLASTTATQHAASTLLPIFLAFSCIASAQADPGDKPVEPMYWTNKDLYHRVFLYKTSTEACSYVIEVYNSRGDYSLTDPVGVENEPGLGNYCQFTYTSKWGYVSTVKYQNWYYRRDFCPEKYSPLTDGKTCRPSPGPYDNTKYPGKMQCEVVGNPIYTGYGNKFQRETDYAFADKHKTSLYLVRTYNSRPAAKTDRLIQSADALSAFGANWLSNFSRTLRVVSNGTLTVLYAYRPDGRLLFFNPGTDGWKPDADIDDRIVELKNSSNGATTGWQYKTGSNEEIENYSANGVLISIQGRDGTQLTLTYSDASTPASVAQRKGQLIRVTDSFGRQLQFTYQGSYVAKMIDPAGKATLYGYDGNGNLTNVTYPDETPATLADNPKKTYVYNEAAYIAGNSRPNALTGIIDENRKRFATFAYDSQGKAILSQHANGVDSYNLVFSTDGSNTQVTDPVGAVRTSRFAKVVGVRRVIGTDQPAGSGCAAASSSIGYDANGNVSYRIDFKGNRTKYVYDLTRNLEISRTEGLNANGTTTPETRTITTDWHPTFRVPVKITEPGLETVYAYDDKGNIILKRLRDLGSGAVQEWTTAYTYSAEGILLNKIEDGPRTDVADLTTDDYYPADAECTGGHLGCRGQLKQTTDALDHVTRITRYTANGQPEEMIDPNGLVTTLVYDARGHVTTMDIGGEQTTYQYDAVGQLTRITEPSGAYLNYRYDDAHRLIEVKDQLNNTLTYTLDNKGNRIKEELFDQNGQLARSQSRVFDALSRLQKHVLPQ